MSQLKKCIFILLIFGITLMVLGMSSELKVVRYHLDTPLEESHTLLLITDLHSCRYGEGASELIEAIRQEKPEAVLIGGDFFDDVLADEQAELLLKGITPQFRTYYVTGNHEYWAGSEAFDKKMSILETYGVRRLEGEVVELQLGDEFIQLAGVDDPDGSVYDHSPDSRSFEEQLMQVEKEVDEKTYSILLSHRPEYAHLYGEMSYDLILAGHAHGGQWRIPGILNGLLAPGQGFFPAYAGGHYQLGDQEMIVSRGLARESTKVPRIYNRPELVMVILE